MAYRYRSRRAAKKYARKSQRNFIFTLVLIGILIYATLTWALPALIGGIGFVKNTVKPSQKELVQTSNNSTLAPPVLNIPFEATNTAQIDIKGFAVPDSRVKLYLDDDPKQTVDVSSDGSFTFTDISLSLGTNNIYGKTLDQDQESLPSKIIKLTFDNDDPPLNINEPDDGKIIQGGDKRIKVSGKTEHGVKVYINNAQVIVNQDGAFSLDQPLNEGANNIVIQAVDGATNTIEVQKRVTYNP